MFSIRGATQLRTDSESEMKEKVCELISAILTENNLEESDLVHIIFSVTDDLHACNPATALRSIGFSSTPLFSTLEPTIHGMLPRTVRVLITVHKELHFFKRHVYLHGAAQLRPDR